MTVRAGWLTNRGDTAGGQTRADTRMLPLGTMTPEGALMVRQGLLPGGDPCAVTASGMTVSVALGRGVMQGSLSAGAYPVAVTAIDQTDVTPGDPLNPRNDIVGLRVYDGLVDGLGEYFAGIEIIEGTPAPAPVDPAPPDTAAWMPLARLRIPAGASAGAPPDWGAVIDDLRVYTTSHGGMLPVSGADLFTPGLYAGQQRYNLTRGQPEQWDGSAWRAVGDYTDWTPAVTASTTDPTGLAVSGRYSVIGSQVTAHLACSWVVGSTAGSGIYGLTLPVPGRRLSGAELHIGECQVVVGGTTYFGVVLGASGAGDVTSIPRIRLADVTADTGSSNWGSGSPATPAAGASIAATLTYEAA